MKKTMKRLSIIPIVIFFCVGCNEDSDSMFSSMKNQLNEIYTSKYIHEVKDDKLVELSVRTKDLTNHIESYEFDLEEGNIREYVFYNHFRDEIWKRIKFEKNGRVKEIWGKGIFVTGNFYDSRLTINDEFEARVYLARPIFGENYLEIQEVLNKDSVITYISKNVEHVNESYVVGDRNLRPGKHKQLYINTITSKYLEEPIIDTFEINFYVRDVGEDK